jgi:hypothetical protein
MQELDAAKANLVKTSEVDEVETVKVLQ